MTTLWTRRLPWPEIDENAFTLKLDRLLVAAIVQTESAGIDKVARYEGSWPYFYKIKEYALANNITEQTAQVLQKISWGPMQVLGAVACELGYLGWLPDLCEPDLGVHFGALKMQQLSKRYTKMEDIVSAYNMGTARKDGMGIYYNQKYVDRVMGYYGELKSLQIGNG